MDMYIISVCFLVFVPGQIVRGAKPLSLDVVLDKEVDPGTDDIYLGQTDNLIITLKIPDGTSSGVEALFIASYSNTVFAIVDIYNYTVGSDISSISNSSWFSGVELKLGPEYTDPTGHVYHYTMATFHLGDVVNDGTNTAEVESYVRIYCEIIYVSLSNYTDGDSYLPAAAIVNSTGSQVFVSRENYILRSKDLNHTSIASFTLSSMSTIEDGGKLEYTDLTMYITNGVATVKLGSYVLTPTQYVSPVKIEMISAGLSYAYSLRQPYIIATRYENCSVESGTSQSLNLEIGTIANKESQKSSAVNTSSVIVMRIYWLVFNTQALGGSFTLGVGVDIDSVNLYVTAFSVTVTSRSPPASPLVNITAVNPGSSTISAGSALSADVTLDTPNGSLHTYDITLLTRKKNTVISKIFILSYTLDHLGTRGDNLPCAAQDIQPLVTSMTDASNPVVRNEGNFSFAILNTGLMNTNHYNFEVKMLSMPDAVPNSIHELVAVVNGVQDIVEYTLSASLPFNASFNLTNDGSNLIPAGGFARAKLTITSRVEKADEYTVKITTREHGGVESKLSLLYHTVNRNVSDAAFVVENPVIFNLMQTDSVNPYVYNEGNMTFIIVSDGIVTSNDVEFYVSMVLDPNAMNGTVYELVADIGGIQDVAEFTVWDQFPFNTTFTATHINSSVIPAGGWGFAEITITSTPETWQEIVVKLETKEKSGTNSMLMIYTYHFPTSVGTSPIVQENPVQMALIATDPIRPLLKNEANMTFNVVNSGILQTNDVMIQIGMIAMPDSVVNDTHELVVDINGVNKTVEFTIGDPILFNGSVGYNISVSITSNTTISPGDKITLELTIQTTPNTMPGSMAIDLPEPYGTPYVKFFSAETKIQGANVVCPPSGTLNYTLSSWNSTAQDNARALVNVPGVCNIQTSNYPVDDIWVIELKLSLMNHSELQDIQVPVTFGLTLNFSDVVAYTANITVMSIEASPTTQAPTTASLQQQVGVVQQNVGASDEGITPWWWIAVGIASAMILVATVTATVVMVMKKNNRRKNKVLQVKEFSKTN